jgi:hypothetical protein
VEIEHQAQPRRERKGWLPSSGSFPLVIDEGICVSLLFVAMTKYLRETTGKEERFILAQGVRGFSPRLAGSTVGQK